MHRFWLWVFLLSWIIGLGILPIFSGMWIWILIPLLLTGTALTVIVGLQLVLFVIGILALFAAMV